MIDLKSLQFYLNINVERDRLNRILFFTQNRRYEYEKTR